MHHSSSAITVYCLAIWWVLLSSPTNSLSLLKIFYQSYFVDRVGIWSSSHTKSSAYFEATMDRFLPTKWLFSRLAFRLASWFSGDLATPPFTLLYAFTARDCCSSAQNNKKNSSPTRRTVVAHCSNTVLYGRLLNQNTAKYCIYKVCHLTWFSLPIQFLYKLENLLRPNNHLLALIYFSYFTLFCSCLCWCVFGTCWCLIFITTIMDKGKGKEVDSFATKLCSSTIPVKSSGNSTTTVKHPIPGVKISEPICNVSNPSLTSKKKPAFDSKALFAKLAPAREKAKKQNELTLVGCVIGKPMDFPRIFTKLKMEWKFIKGEIWFNDIKHNWVEIIFSNPLDLKKVWEGMPYHVHTQLLLLINWEPSFTPSTESIAVLDLWARIFKLPSVFATTDALKEILEANNFGTLLKLDPTQNRRTTNKFTRVCLTINMETVESRELFIPVSENCLQKFIIWFDDFPAGCGSCGALEHLYDQCAERVQEVPKLAIKLKKASSRLKKEGGWSEVGQSSGTSAKTAVKPVNAIRASLAGGVIITYESEDSSENVDLLSKGNDEIKTTCDPASSNVDILNSENVDVSLEQAPTVILSSESGTPGPTVVRLPEPLQQAPLPTQTPTDDLPDVNGMDEDPPSPDPLLSEGKVDYKDSSEFEDEQYEDDVDEEEEYSEVEDPDEEEDFLMEEETIPISVNYDYVFPEEEKVKPVVDSTVFVDADIDAFLAAPELYKDPVMLPNNSTVNSNNHSIHSSSSMVRKMDNLDVNPSDVTNSHSGKRKVKDGTYDTASSGLMGNNKKPRFDNE